MVSTLNDSLDLSNLAAQANINTKLKISFDLET